ncbi:hypothetical protein ADEAN_000254000 [Angomonas deanei]|uniref:Uncharacterized protein n=1 Tax=Angomonas deanei TaxID=59799 RepID=A0A7G2C8E6_9TRYP|nr:hypothetical protein ADEAN_000254000 [Angomonas deanei]
MFKIVLVTAALLLVVLGGVSASDNSLSHLPNADKQLSYREYYVPFYLQLKIPAAEFSPDVLLSTLFAYYSSDDYYTQRKQSPYAYALTENITDINMLKVYDWCGMTDAIPEETTNLYIEYTSFCTKGAQFDSTMQYVLVFIGVFLGDEYKTPSKITGKDPPIAYQNAADGMAYIATLLNLTFPNIPSYDVRYLKFIPRQKLIRSADWYATDIVYNPDVTDGLDHTDEEGSLTTTEVITSNTTVMWAIFGSLLGVVVIFIVTCFVLRRRRDETIFLSNRAKWRKRALQHYEEIFPVERNAPPPPPAAAPSSGVPREEEGPPPASSYWPSSTARTTETKRAAPLPPSVNSRNTNEEEMREVTEPSAPGNNSLYFGTRFDY